MDYKYDVFISYSRKDYVNNGEVIPGNPVSAIQNILTKNHISFWFDKDGIYSGDEFIEVITEAIVSSKMLIFVSSKASNLSEWTAGEILLAKKHKKAILPVRIDDSDYNRKFELVLLAHDFVNYYESEQESLEKILKAVKKNNEEIALQHVKAEIRELANDCLLLLNQQDTLVKTLVAKNLSVGVTTKDCPVCGKSTPLGEAFCGRCGWRFPVLYALGGSHGTAGDKHHLTLARANWQKVNADAEAVFEKQKLEGENAQLKAALDEISAECKALAADLTSKDMDLRSLQSQSEAQNTQLKELIKLKKSLTDEVEKLQSQLLDNETERSNMLKKLMQTQDELQKAKTEVDAKQKELLALQKKIITSSSSSRKSPASNDGQLTFSVKGVSFKMIRVEGKGAPYYIGETPVTQALWKAVMGNNPSSFKGDNLSWNDCQEFIKKVNKETGKTFRLPKEAEWEYAAKGGRMEHGYEYSGSNNIEEVAWYKNNSGSETHPVKNKKPNELGIYDMSGNVWEWCEDLVGSRRVYRGGSWGSDATFCRVASRYIISPSDRGDALGFRLAL